MDETDTLKLGEPHPCAKDAFQYIRKNMTVIQALMLSETFASTAISGNRIGQICGETLRRILAGEPVSDRYLLGLAWFIRDTIEKEQSE